MMPIVPAAVAGMLLSLFCLAPAHAAGREFQDAAAQYQAHRYSDAYGRFIALADNGDAEAARIVLFMHQYGALLYGSHWDLDTEQAGAYRQLAQPPKIRPPAARAAAAGAAAPRGIRAQAAPPAPRRW